MGNVASSVRDAGLQRLAFSPPPLGYSETDFQYAFTADKQQKMATKLFTPTTVRTFPATVDDTKERWRTRKDYVDTRLLCIFSHGNADDIGTSALYSQWLSDTFDMNVARIALPAALCARFARGISSVSAALIALV